MPLARRVRAPLLALAAAAALAPALALPAAAQARRAEPTVGPELLRPFRFRSIGPGNMSGRITAVAVPEGSGGKTIYAGTAGGGVWKTVNRGTTWQPIFDDQELTDIGDVAVAPSDPRTVWVGTGERNSLRSQGWGNGVYRSTDGGATWRHMGLADTREMGRIVIHPRDPRTVWVAALGHLWGANRERGVYRTTDGGESWQKVLFVNDTTGFVDLKMDPSDPDVLYAAAWHRLRWGGGRMQGAGAGSGIYKSADGGRTWQKLGGGLPTGPLGRIGLAVAPKSPRTVYAVVQAATSNVNPSVSATGGLFRSDDAGASWTRVNDVSAVPDYFYNEVWVDPNDAEHIYLNGTYLMESHDGGRTVQRVELGNVHVDHHAFWIDPADSDHLVLGSDGGVYISHDRGESWAHQNIPVGQFYEVSIDSTKTPYYVCGGLQDNGVWCGPSQTREQRGITRADWYGVYGGDGFHSAVAPDDPNTYYAESQFGVISRCDVALAQCTPIKPTAEDAGPESGYDFRWDWNAPFVISQHDPRTLYLGGNHLFRLSDRGARWEILGPDMTRQSRARPEPIAGHTSYGALHSIAESPLDRDVIWTGSDDGLIWTTTDGGRSWTQVTDNLPDAAPRRCWVSEIEASRHDARTAFVTFDCHMRDDYTPYVYRTSDGGRSWTSLSGDLPRDVGSYVVRQDPRNPQLLFLGTQRGVYLSTTGGGRWVRLKNNLPTSAVRDMDYALRANDLVVGTFGRSIWVLDVGPLQELTPQTLAKPAHLFAVETARHFNTADSYEAWGDQVYTAPNPPQGAVFHYHVREDLGRDVTLTVRRGTEVVQTLTGSGRPGIHQLTWNLRGREPRARELGGPTSPDELRLVPAGSYTVEMRVGDATQSQTFAVEHGWPGHAPGRMR